ncbi:hypothetical protein DKL61_09610 [Gammaproteobacteria bacterium ESL0073]|nr:hypothetical protein DKL61_09610 [Gammaproteobacteria bacterium ESL0073]
MISTQQWLETIPDNLTIYVLLGSISSAKPVTAYFKKINQVNLTALWQETPYANWFEAMPYIAPIPRDSKFFDWVDKTKSKDWGWLAASPYEPETIRQHFKSLTKVLMPDGMDVFFRYWDGKYLYPILEHLNQKQQAAQLIPVFSHYLINQQALEVALSHNLPEPKAYPWWRVEQQLMDKLTEADNGTLVENLLSALKEDNAPLYLSYPESTLRLKASHFVEMENYTLETLVKQFKAFLLEESI